MTLDDHPANWTAPELKEREDWRQSWSDAEHDEIRASLEATRESRDLADALRETRVGNRMAEIQESLEHGSGAVWLRGLALDDVSPADTERLFTALMSLVGTPVSQTAAGDRLFHVRDEGFGAADSRTRGPNTNRRLSFHTDRCDVISFLCIRPATKGGDNEIVSSVAICNRIARQRPDLLEVLKQPFLYQRHNVDLNHPDPYIRQPIFSIFEGHFAANLLRVLIERAYAADDTPAMTDAQREALDYVESLAEEDALRVRFRQERGDIVMLNNFVTLHRRAEFEDDDDPALRRHLLRIWLSVPNSRPLDPMFAGNYGDTAAGAVRGGMRGT